MSTIPERVAIIQPALRSLLDQSAPADRILIAWPERSLRTGRPYPACPSLPRGVDVVRCTDEGPATKLLETLRLEQDAAVVVVDDDVIYPRDFLADLLRAHREDPGAALGLRGWRVRPGTDPRRHYHVFCTAVAAPADVDVLLGTWGYLLPPRALDRSVHEFDGWPQEVRWVDDIWISGHLAMRQVPRRVIPTRSFPIESRAAGIAALTDGLNRSGHNDRVAIEAFAAWW